MNFRKNTKGENAPVDIISTKKMCHRGEKNLIPSHSQ